MNKAVAIFLLQFLASGEVVSNARSWIVLGLEIGGVEGAVIWLKMLLHGPASPHPGAIGVMTAVTTVTRGAAPTRPATTISSPARTGDASQSSSSATRTTTVETGRTSRSTCATPQNPHAPLISSAVTTGTALTW